MWNRPRWLFGDSSPQRLYADASRLLHRLEPIPGPQPPTSAEFLTRMRARFVRMNRRTFRLSSQLDRRVVTCSPWTDAVSLADLLAMQAEQTASPQPIRFIFHSAFCGSTLLANALDLPGKSLPYKEPLALTQLCQLRELEAPAVAHTEDQWRQLAELVVRLLSKTFAPGEISVVKPSNDCSSAIEPLMLAAGLTDGRHAARGIFLYADLPTFLCACLKSPARRLWAKKTSRWSLRHGCTATGTPLNWETAEDAVNAANVWLSQMMNYLRASQSIGGEALRSLNDHQLFHHPAATLAAVAEFFQIALSADEAEAIVAGPVFTTYSKQGARRGPVGRWLGRFGLLTTAPTRFTAQDRAAELAQLEATYRSEIEAGVDWLIRQTTKTPIPAVLPNPLMLPPTNSDAT